MAAGPRLNGKAATAAIFAVTAAFVLAADLLTKWLAFRYVGQNSHRVVIPDFLNLLHVENRGAVLGIGQGKQMIFILFTLVAVPAIVWAAWKYGRASRFLTFGLGCVLGGALGNLWDRLFLGSVRDFIDVGIGQHRWWTFNVADAAICVGAAVLILHSYWPSAAQKTGQKK